MTKSSLKSPGRCTQTTGPQPVLVCERFFQLSCAHQRIRINFIRYFFLLKAHTLVCILVPAACTYHANPLAMAVRAGATTMYIGARGHSSIESSMLGVAAGAHMTTPSATAELVGMLVEGLRSSESGTRTVAAGLLEGAALRIPML